jgi:hypothetical protein
MHPVSHDGRHKLRVAVDAPPQQDIEAGEIKFRNILHRAELDFSQPGSSTMLPSIKSAACGASPF